jgi:hypothetical protein
MSAPGLKLAARYSYRPFTLGFCGPQNNEAKKIITNYLLGEKNLEDKVKGVFEKFIGAYPYYQLIAWKNKIKDPFDKKVVEAYWVGNKLLEKVSKKDIALMILGAFSLPGWLPLPKAKKVIEDLPLKSLPHHSFHVLFLGSVTDTVAIKGKAIDLCRISWGQVKKVSGDKLIVEYKPLILKPRPRLAGKIKKEISYEPNFGVIITVGDWVSFHWDFVSDKLDKIQVKNLEKYTLHNLKLYG